MRTTFERASSLSDYWNNDFLKNNYISEETHNLWYTKTGVCSPIHISDEQKWGKYWTILMNNIGCYKFLEKSAGNRSCILNAKINNVFVRPSSPLAAVRSALQQPG